MRHLKRGGKLSRVSSQRKALHKSLVSGVIQHGRIKTTLAKAKSASPILEKLITRAKKGDLTSYRLTSKMLHPKLVKQLVKEIAPKYKSRKGGYTRIIKLGLRKSDAAPLAILELV